MRTALLLLPALAAAVLSSTAAATDVWKWVDEKGTTHYSDQPVAGASKIEVRTGNVVETAPAAASNSSSAPQQPAVTNYRNFEIWRPEPEQTFSNTAGQIDVEIRIEPEVQPQHQLSLYLDGKLVTGSPRNALSYSLSDVARGAHQVTAAIADRNGKTIQETKAVVFYVRQESIANPPTGPGVRPPPPKPTPHRAANKMLTQQPSYNALNGSAHAVIDPATNMPVVRKSAPKPGKP
jgi:uncharacterized protein DUF4124